MKRSIINMTLATAALLVASTAASAQTLKADIPFAFNAGGKTLPAGTYVLRGSMDEGNFVIRGADVRNTVILMTLRNHDPQKTWKSGNSGVLQFVCNNGCTLHSVWSNKGFPAHDFAGPKAEEGSRVALIRAAVGK